MTEEEMHKLGEYLTTMGQRLLNHKGLDMTGLGMWRIITQNIEICMDCKVITNLEWHTYEENYRKVCEELRAAREKIEWLDMGMREGK
jgi:hypothetical protein